ncbi:MAG: TerB family tellurite resistance protein [Cellvibrionaceae bacterium]
MHILIGLVTAIAGLIWALYRLQDAGLNLNALNPFYWVRRRQWEKQLGTKPVHRLTDPMEAAALLVVAAAKLEGEVTRELKAEVIELFQKEFGIDQRQAREYYAASSHLLTDVVDVVAEVKDVLAPTLTQFQSRHKQSLIQMLNTISASEGASTPEQVALIAEVGKQLDAQVKTSW